MTYSRALIQKYASPVPRYTSYPTAPHFDKSVDTVTVQKWMKNIAQEDPISIYIHIPFCDRLCWFCGCHTKHTLKYKPIRRYLSNLYSEIMLARRYIGKRVTVSHIHLGGGSPSLLKAQDLRLLRRVLDDCFIISSDTEISIEFDPSDLTRESIKPFFEFGLTRASIGVQDFDTDVQTAINRLQSFEKTREVVDILRDCGVRSLNIDALYGLPHQNLDTIESTFDKVIALDPDRIALFGYAHVPWVKPHQKMIEETALPDIYDRFWQNKLGSLILQGEGYTQIGIDHFAKPGDSLALDYQNRKVRRNFQGYTNDNAKTLIGFGTSAISQFAEGYAQNVKDAHSYHRVLSGNQLPIERGLSFSASNLAYGGAISELMTYFSLTLSSLNSEFGSRALPIFKRADEIARADSEGFFVKTRKGYRITPRGRPFTRTIASYFDEYLDANHAKYSVAV